jgi:16S rRNA G527 N7-methylase RsmG
MLFLEKILTFIYKHILHSLELQRLWNLSQALCPWCRNGWGFPGIPLAIFQKLVLLIDVIAKKKKVVQGVVDALELKCKKQNSWLKMLKVILIL